MATPPVNEPASDRAASRSPAIPIVMMLLALGLDAALLAVGVGGVGALLRHPRALALLGTWIAAYPVLTVLRPPRTRDHARVKPDPVVLLLLTAIPVVTPVLSALGERHGLWPLPGGGVLRWGGVALSAGGFALRIAAMKQLGTRFSPLVALERGHALETSGVYARMRHPGYLGAWLGNLGIVLAFGSGAALALVALMAWAYVARIRPEEALLEQHFGAAWRDYRARAGMFLPRP
jgi:protein-S-isoprenylcysteine O-methyltransferase Ste14